MKMMHSTPCLALLLGFLLAGCSAETPTQADASTTQAEEVPDASPALPEGWRFVAGTEVPQVESATPQLPATVRSDDGVDVVVDDISRVIAGGDDVIAVMEALGLSSSVYAAPQRSATEAGRNAPKQFLFNRNTGAEGVLSLDATLFIGNSLRRHAQSGLAEKLRGAGLDAVVIDDLQPAPEKVRKIGATFGLPAQAEALATLVEAQQVRAQALGEAHARKPRVIHVSASGAGGRPTVGGTDNAASALIRLAGGINIGDEAGVANYSELSPEGVVASHPDVILVSENDLALFGGEEGLWKSYPTLKLTPAGQANRVWVMPDIQLKATSIASGTGALALAEALVDIAQ